MLRGCYEETATVEFRLSVYAGGSVSGAAESDLYTMSVVYI